MLRKVLSLRCLLSTTHEISLNKAASGFFFPFGHKSNTQELTHIIVSYFILSKSITLEWKQIAVETKVGNDSLSFTLISQGIQRLDYFIILIWGAITMTLISLCSVLRLKWGKKTLGGCSFISWFVQRKKNTSHLSENQRKNPPTGPFYKKWHVISWGAKIRTVLACVRGYSFLKYLFIFTSGCHKKHD